MNTEKVLYSRYLRSDMTTCERLLWEQLRGRKLMDFKLRRQQVIDGYIVDFYCADTGVVLELALQRK